MLRELYIELKIDLNFLVERLAEYINRKRIKGPNLSKEDPVYLLRKNIKTIRLSLKLDYTKLRLFKIKKKKGLVTFILDLPKDIRIYPIFYILLLELALKNAKL